MTTTGTSSETTPKKKNASSVRHTRAVQRDRSKRPPAAPPDEQVSARLMEIIHPATLAQLDYYRQVGLRERILTLPVMVALVLSLIWRQVGGVCELVRLAQSEKMLWAPLLKVSQSAFSQRLGTFPAELFLRILTAVLPLMQQRWLSRQRPCPPEIAWATARYPQVWVVDGSTLDALLRKVGLLGEAVVNPLAGRMMALLELGSRLPRQLWYTPDPTTHDQGFWEAIWAVLPAGALLIFDLGFTNFQVYTARGHFLRFCRRFPTAARPNRSPRSGLFFASRRLQADGENRSLCPRAVYQQLTTAAVTFITRAKRNLAYQVSQTFRLTAQVHDRLVWIGKDETRQPVRLIEVLYRGAWYRYVTNELDPLVLPAEEAVARYRQRWRIEEAFNLVKRLLGLAYFWTASENGVCLQLWATWLLYVVLVDLTDAVAEALNRPFAALSLEMVYRSLYYFTQAYHRDEATHIVTYLATHAQWLGIIKRQRKSKSLSPANSPLTAGGEP